MVYKNFDVSDLEEKSIAVFISFSLATAKHTSYSLVRFFFPKNCNAKLPKLFENKLRYLKKSGAFECYTDFLSLTSNKTEARYLCNKYPDLIEETLDEGECAFFVKLL